MSDAGIPLLFRLALLLFLIVTGAAIHTFIGRSKQRGRVVLVGTLGGLAAGLLISKVASPLLGEDVSTLSATFGMVLGWAVAAFVGRRFPRQASP